jgi:CTP synthase (UTP-ammonia lyase)
MLAHRLRIQPFYKKARSSRYSANENHDLTKISSSKVIQDWIALADSVDSPDSECTIAMVGKYVDQGDACKYYRLYGSFVDLLRGLTCDLTPL